MIPIGLRSIRRCFGGGDKHTRDDNSGSQTVAHDDTKIRVRSIAEVKPTPDWRNTHGDSRDDTPNPKSIKITENDAETEVRSIAEAKPARNWKKTHEDIESMLAVYQQGRPYTLPTVVHDTYKRAFEDCRWNLSHAGNGLSEVTNDNFAGQMKLNMNAYPLTRRLLDHHFNRVGHKLTLGPNTVGESGTRATSESPNTSSMLTAPDIPGIESRTIDCDSLNDFTKLHAFICDKVDAEARQVIKDVLTRYASIRNMQLTPGVDELEGNVTNWESVGTLLEAAAGEYSWCWRVLC
jgi:hypothetical protein